MKIPDDDNQDGGGDQPDPRSVTSFRFRESAEFFPPLPVPLVDPVENSSHLYLQLRGLESNQRRSVGQNHVAPADRATPNQEPPPGDGPGRTAVQGLPDRRI